MRKFILCLTPIDELITSGIEAFSRKIMLDFRLITDLWVSRFLDPARKPAFRSKNLLSICGSF
jgi:hypothetical protein